MKRTVYTIGESLLDLIFTTENTAISSVGGSLLNTSISLAKAGNKVSFISETGNDHAGKLILNSLKSSGIDVSNINVFDKNQTAVALAFLDENKNADYNFYKNYPLKRDLIIPEIADNDVLMFGSVYAVTNELRKSIKKILNKAHLKNTIVYYDPNIRKHCNNDDLQTYFYENISFADIIKTSDEDVYNIFGNISFDDVYNNISKMGCKNLIITQNKYPVLVFTENYKIQIQIPEIKVVSSIGAGDAFNAGLVHQILKNNIYKEQIPDLNADKWEDLIKTAINFATEVCKIYQNYISDEFAANITNCRE